MHWSGRQLKRAEAKPHSIHPAISGYSNLPYAAGPDPGLGCTGLRRHACLLAPHADGERVRHLSVFSNLSQSTARQRPFCCKLARCIHVDTWRLRQDKIMSTVIAIRMVYTRPAFSCCNRRGALICGGRVNPSQDEGSCGGLVALQPPSPPHRLNPAELRH